MANKKISELDPADPLDGTEHIEIAQSVGGSLVPRKATTAEVADLAASISPVTALSIASGVVTIDCSLGRDFTLALTANVSSIVLVNLKGAGNSTEIEIQFTQDGTGSRVVAIPSSFKALGGSDTVVAAAANAVTVLSAKTFDNGTTWRYAMQESA